MIDAERVANFLRETAASEILPRYRTLRPEDIREKGPGDLVTIADLEAERHLTEKLRLAAPDSIVLGEEAVAEDRSLLAALAGDRPVWIIDPIDGTGNFARGRPGFGVIVALVEHASVVAGWIYDPLADVMVVAERGGGAWSNGQRLAVAPPAAPGELNGAAYGRTAAGQRAALAIEASGRLGPVRNLGCSALEYLEVALGRAHYSLHSRSLPWDHAAGMLITEEAGGKSGFLDGTEYDPRIPDRPVLAASGAIAWDEVAGIIGSMS
jgi:fructose-1,6-bisphosphatase/inositol monophosphatase family enzyme